MSLCFFRLVSGGEDNNESNSSITISGKLNLEGIEKGKMTESISSNKTYKCLHITVIPCAPCLQVILAGFMMYSFLVLSYLCNVLA